MRSSRQIAARAGRLAFVRGWLVALAALSAQPFAQAVDGDLRQALAAAAPGERVRAYLVLADQLSAKDLAAQAAGASPRERSARVAAALKAHAEATQAPVRALLTAAAAEGRASVRHVLWMGNAIVFEAEPDVVERLAAVPGVDRIRLDRALPAAQQQDVPPAPPPPPPGVGSFPFADDFETGVLAPHWTLATTAAGYAAVTSGNGPVGGFHLVMASATGSVDSTASVTVQLDLSGQSDVGIRFRHKEFDDENHFEDAVLVSADGVLFFSVISLQAASATYTWKWIDLDDVLPGLGIGYSSTFHVRFQWRDNFDIPADGFAFDDIEIAPGAGVQPPAEPEPNLVALQAPAVWAQGYDGDGVLLGTIDSGTLWTHPDLVDRTWLNPGEIAGNALDDDGNGFVDDLRGWDFAHDDADVTSTDKHGTQTAGLMVGDGAAGRITGMAPGATLVICEIDGATDYWAAQQYLLDVGVDVVSSSYSYKWPSRPDYHMFRQLCDVELAAGIVHANSIGNNGTETNTHPIPFNVSTPGNVPGPFTHPALALGGRSSVLACGGIQLPGDTLYTPSGRGPSAWEDLLLYDPLFPHAQDPDYWDYPYGGFGGPGPGLGKPDLMAYTNTVMTTDFGGGYTTFTGTSASAPQLGGALALLRQVQPEALPRHLAGALELTAVDLGAPGRDDVYGAGKIAAWSAARRLLVLGRFDPNELALGEPFDLNLFGPPGRLVYAFFHGALATGTGDWNMPPGFFFLDAFLTSSQGSATVSAAIPNDPLLQGITVWFQFGAEAPDFSWGAGPWLSVPEPLVIE